MRDQTSVKGEDDVGALAEEGRREGRDVPVDDRWLSSDDGDEEGSHECLKMHVGCRLDDVCEVNCIGLVNFIDFW